MLMILAILATGLAVILYLLIGVAAGFHSGRPDPGTYFPAHGAAIFAALFWVLWFFLGGQPMSW